MKLQNGDVFQSREPLQKLLNEKFPVKTAYGLAKLASKFNGQFKVIEDVRQNLLRKYGEDDGKGNIAVKPDGENWPKFVEDFTFLMEQEIELDIEKVKLPDCQIEPSVLIALEKVVEV